MSIPVLLSALKLNLSNEDKFRSLLVNTMEEILQTSKENTHKIRTLFFKKYRSIDIYNEKIVEDKFIGGVLEIHLTAYAYKKPIILDIKDIGKEEINYHKHLVSNDDRIIISKDGYKYKVIELLDIRGSPKEHLEKILSARKLRFSPVSEILTPNTGLPSKPRSIIKSSPSPSPTISPMSSAPSSRRSSGNNQVSLLNDDDLENNDIDNIDNDLSNVDVKLKQSLTDLLTLKQSLKNINDNDDDDDKRKRILNRLGLKDEDIENISELLKSLNSAKTSLNNKRKLSMVDHLTSVIEKSKKLPIERILILTELVRRFYKMVKKAIDKRKDEQIQSQNQNLQSQYLSSPITMEQYNDLVRQINRIEDTIEKINERLYKKTISLQKNSLYGGSKQKTTKRYNKNINYAKQLKVKYNYMHDLEKLDKLSKGKIILIFKKLNIPYKNLKKSSMILILKLLAHTKYGIMTKSGHLKLIAKILDIKGYGNKPELQQKIYMKLRRFSTKSF